MLDILTNHTIQDELYKYIPKKVFSNHEIHMWFEHVLKLKMSPELFARCCIPNVLDLNDHLADVFRSQKTVEYGYGVVTTL